MKNALGLVLILAVTPSAKAATPVDGVLLGQRVWTAAGSPYQVAKDTFLPAGSTLTLQAGTVIEMSTGNDSTIPNVTPLVDWVIQGNLIVLGTEKDPVKVVPSQPDVPWGALYLASREEQRWQGLQLEHGRLVTASTHLTLQNCRILKGDGLQVAANSQVDLVDCQIDENRFGLSLWDVTAAVRMSRTRLWKNGTSLYFKAPAVLVAADSEVLESEKWNVVNATASPVKVPVLWWGTKDATDVTGKVLDGKRKAGLGPVEFEGLAAKDPLMATAKGFVPGLDPQKRFWKGPHFFAGPYFQWVTPSVKVPNSPFSGSLGYGAAVGLVVSPAFDARAVVQAVSFTATNTAKKSHSDLSMVQFGVEARPRMDLDKKKEWSLFAQGGGMFTQSRLEATYPSDDRNVDSEPVRHNTDETGVGLTVGAGIERRMGSWHRAEAGFHYSTIPLSGTRGGGAFIFQLGVNLYFR